MAGKGKRKGKKGKRKVKAFRSGSSGVAAAAPARRRGRRRRRSSSGMDRAVIAGGAVAGIALGTTVPYAHQLMRKNGVEPAIKVTRGWIGKIAATATIAAVGVAAFTDGPVGTAAVIGLTGLAAGDQALVNQDRIGG